MSRFSFVAIAIAAVAVAGFGGAARAGRAHATSFTYSLSPGQCTGAQNIPAINVPVQVMGTMVTSEDEGLGQATLTAFTAPANFVGWVGTDIHSTAVTSGYGNSASHIVWLDYYGYVDLQVATDTQVRVCNAIGSPFNPATGTVTFLY